MFEKVFVFVNEDTDLRRVNVKVQVFPYNSHDAIEAKKNYEKLIIKSLFNGFEIYCDGVAILNKNLISQFNYIYKESKSVKDVGSYGPKNR